MNVDEIAEQLRWFGCITDATPDYGLALLKSGFAGPGWYVWCEEYPEDGSVHLGGDGPELREALEVAKVIVECEAAQLAAAFEVTSGLLLLVGLELRRSSFYSWRDETRREVETWASLSHLSASDNPVRVPPKPEVLRWSTREVAG